MAFDQFSTAHGLFIEGEQIIGILQNCLPIGLPQPDDVVTLPDAQAAFFPGPLGGFACGDALYGLPQESNVEYGATLGARNA